MLRCGVELYSHWVPLLTSTQVNTVLRKSQMELRDVSHYFLNCLLCRIFNHPRPTAVFMQFLYDLALLPTERSPPSVSFFRTTVQIYFVSGETRLLMALVRIADEKMLLNQIQKKCCFPEDFRLLTESSVPKKLDCIVAIKSL